MADLSRLSAADLAAFVVGGVALQAALHIATQTDAGSEQDGGADA